VITLKCMELSHLWVFVLNFRLPVPEMYHSKCVRKQMLVERQNITADEILSIPNQGGYITLVFGDMTSADFVKHITFTNRTSRCGDGWHYCLFDRPCF
jgi:hypothetical protein